MNAEIRLTETHEPAAWYCAEFAIVPAWAYRRLAGHPQFTDLLAFYVQIGLFVVGKGNQGWKHHTDLTQITGLSVSTIQRRTRDLKALGLVTVRRKQRPDGKKGENVYHRPLDDPDLLPPEDVNHRSPKVTGGEGDHRSPRMTGGPQVTQGDLSSPETTSTHNNGDSLRSSPSAPASPTPGGSQLALIPDEVLDAEIVDERNLPAAIREANRLAAGLNAGVLTKQWGKWCEDRGVKIPERKIKIFAKEIKSALDQGFSRDLIGAALQSMARDRLFDRPELLPNHLVRVQAGPSLPPERLSRVQADRLRQAGETPTDSAAAVAAFLAVPDPRKVANP